jgi:hypothetical protein
MILNSDSVEMIRLNASRLAHCIRNKDDLVDLATASSFEQVFSAIETLLTNTDMFFDDDLISSLDMNNWQSFKATLLVYTLNIVNKMALQAKEPHYGTPYNREFGASHTTL